MSTRLLVIGDVHLGRSPTGLTDEVRDLVDAGDISPARALAAAAAEAIARKVDAVLFAGDLVDDERDFFEAYSTLVQTLRPLADAGIPILGVAGNHDVEVLPRLACEIEAFRLVGAGGSWEGVEVRGAEGPAVTVLGWSFPRSHVNESPLLANLPRPPDDGRPAIGLLHADRDASSSRFAPVRSAELAGHPADAWLLGHIHRPDPLEGDRPVGYLGTLAPLDPSETGPHGPWLVEVEGKGSVRARHLPLAALRFEEDDLDVSDLGGADAVEAALARRPAEVRARVAGTGASPRVLGLRIRLRGTSPVRAEIDRRLPGACGLIVQDEGGGVAFIQKIRNEIVPLPDLAAAARGRDPVALLARRILLIDGPGDDPARKRLVGEARRRLANVTRKAVYQRLAPEPPDEESAVRLLRAAALRALADLLASREESA